MVREDSNDLSNNYSVSPSWLKITARYHSVFQPSIKKYDAAFPIKIVPIKRYSLYHIYNRSDDYKYGSKESNNVVDSFQYTVFWQVSVKIVATRDRFGKFNKHN